MCFLILNVISFIRFPIPCKEKKIKKKKSIKIAMGVDLFVLARNNELLGMFPNKFRKNHTQNTIQAFLHLIKSMIEIQY